MRSLLFRNEPSVTGSGCDRSYSAFYIWRKLIIRLSVSQLHIRCQHPLPRSLFKNQIAIASWVRNLAEANHPFIR
ncbi:MAG: hypothetical protein F6J93_11270 [Oscillatoria sp. SIO1A7]|nr:hypothetical protein [Oscillatoria sp. SIO1A7]